MGKVYNETGHPDLARRCFVRALKIQPTNPEATLEMKRLKEAKAPQAAKGSFFKNLFSKDTRKAVGRTLKENQSATDPRKAGRMDDDIQNIYSRFPM